FSIPTSSFSSAVSPSRLEPIISNDFSIPSKCSSFFTSSSTKIAGVEPELWPAAGGVVVETAFISSMDLDSSLESIISNDDALDPSSSAEIPDVKLDLWSAAGGVMMVATAFSSSTGTGPLTGSIISNGDALDSGCFSSSSFFFFSSSSSSSFIRAVCCKPFSFLTLVNC
ncbi:hypothetical protein NEQG_02713, partial [Nematocida parisii ERTm3]